MVLGLRYCNAYRIPLIVFAGVGLGVGWGVLVTTWWCIWDSSFSLDTIDIIGFTAIIGNSSNNNMSKQCIGYTGESKYIMDCSGSCYNEMVMLSCLAHELAMIILHYESNKFTIPCGNLYSYCEKCIKHELKTAYTKHYNQYCVQDNIHSIEQVQKFFVPLIPKLIDLAVVVYDLNIDQKELNKWAKYTTKYALTIDLIDLCID